MPASSAKKRVVTRIVYGVFVLAVAAFVVSNVYQVAVQVFFTPETEADLQIHPKVNADCETALRAEIEAIEKARAQASRELNPENARTTYTKLHPKTSGDLEKACANDPNGPSAQAAIAQLDRLAETHAFRESTDLRAVRLAAQSFIRSAVP